VDARGSGADEVTQEPLLAQVDFFKNTTTLGRALLEKLLVSPSKGFALGLAHRIDNAIEEFPDGIALLSDTHVCRLAFQQCLMRGSGLLLKSRDGDAEDRSAKSLLSPAVRIQLQQRLRARGAAVDSEKVSVQPTAASHRRSDALSPARAQAFSEGLLAFVLDAFSTLSGPSISHELFLKCQKPSFPRGLKVD
jgi:hypothetical protein